MAVCSLLNFIACVMYLCRSYSAYSSYEAKGKVNSVAESLTGSDPSRRVRGHIIIMKDEADPHSDRKVGTGICVHTKLQ